MSYEQMQNNQVYLSGQIASAPEFSHEIMGEKFYDTTVSVERLSGQATDLWKGKTLKSAI